MPPVAKSTSGNASVRYMPLARATVSSAEPGATEPSGANASSPSRPLSANKQDAAQGEDEDEELPCERLAVEQDHALEDDDAVALERDPAPHDGEQRGDNGDDR